MIHLVIFLFKWLFIGKPKTKQTYWVVNSKEPEPSVLFDQRIEKIIKDKKWEIIKIEKIPTDFDKNKERFLVHLKQRY